MLPIAEDSVESLQFALSLASDADLPARGSEMPCIRCGDCAMVCPAGLLPQQLHVAARSDDSAALARFGLSACIECGCCDVVCPSHIPLTESFRTGKQKFLQAMNHDDRVRWFDAREQRKQDGIHRWEERHGQSEDERIESPPSKQRLEHVAEVIGRLGRLLETADP